MGPYNKGKGYLPAGALSDGTTTTSYGGGTCQVSSTLYNALLQLPGINILYRRAHGENAAPYLPHGVDAAVGNKRRTSAGATTTTSRFASKRTPAATARCVC